MSFSSPSEGHLGSTLGVRRVSAGRQNTELLKDFLPVILWASHPRPQRLGDKAAHRASEARLLSSGAQSGRTPRRGRRLSCLT